MGGRFEEPEVIIEILDLGAPTDAKKSRRKHRNPKGEVGWAWLRTRTNLGRHGSMHEEFTSL